MGFIYILLVVLGITTVAYLAKLSTENGVSSFDFTFVLFTAASAFGYLFAKLNNVATADYTPELCWISVIAGIGGATAVFIFNHAVRIGHFGYSNAIYRTSFLVPVIFSIIVFRSILNMTTIVGIVFILTSIFLISWSNNVFAKTRGGNIRWFIAIICAFLLSGLPRIGQLLTSHNRLNSFAYLFLSYAAGFILLLIVFLFRRQRVKPRALFYGSVAAFASFVGVYCTIEALKLLSAGIVFPLTLSTPIILGMLISYIYRERIRPVGWIGVLTGICGILILSFQIYIKQG